MSDVSLSICCERIVLEGPSSLPIPRALNFNCGDNADFVAFAGRLSVANYHHSAKRMRCGRQLHRAWNLVHIRLREFFSLCFGFYRNFLQRICPLDFAVHHFQEIHDWRRPPMKREQGLDKVKIKTSQRMSWRVYEIKHFAGGNAHRRTDLARGMWLA